MTTPEVVTRWRCDHCRRSYASKSYAGLHETHCSRNPAERTCSTCVHFERQPCCSEATAECGCGGRNRCAAGVFDRAEVFGDWLRDCETWEGER